MASVFFEKQHGRYRIRFEYQGVSYNRSLGKSGGRPEDDRREAGATLLSVEKTLRALADGFLVMPEGTTDPGRFIISGGKEGGEAKRPAVATLDQLFEAARQNTPAGSKEENTQETDELHRKHLIRLLGGRTRLHTMTPNDLQTYITARSAETHHGDKISGQTIYKEIGRLRADWNTARRMKLLGGLGEPPTFGLVYPKDTTKPPFRTRDQIENVLATGGLSEEERVDLWSSLFLRVSEIAELLEVVRGRAAYPFILPMFAFVAYTGARRSEMIRSRVEDIDFASNLVRIREKKRDRSKEVTFRHVDLAPPLARVLRAWFDGGHPGGPYTVCQPRKTRMKARDGWVPLTKDEARHHFEQALAGTEWAVVPGFHCFRHSFASNAAAQGVPQSRIDAWMGHQTAEMRDRYRHLLPEQGRSSIVALFGQ